MIQSHMHIFVEAIVQTILVLINSDCRFRVLQLTQHLHALADAAVLSQIA